MCFVAFGIISLLYKTWSNLGWTGAISENGSCHEVVSEFFATNATDPPHWTLNSCFGVYCNIWMHSGPFGCFTKLGAKRAELVQKFVPLTCVKIFRNERTRSTPLDPKLMFWCVSYYLGAFRTVWLPYESRCKTGRTSAKVRATKSCRNFWKNAPDPPHWNLNWKFSAFRTI